MERDPVEARADDGLDLYDISTWESRTALDRLSVTIYNGALTVGRAVLVLVALFIILAQFALGGIGAMFSSQPGALALVALSAVPALALFAYVYRADVTTPEPLELVVGTFILGILFAGFAAIVNTSLGGLQRFPVVGLFLFFFLVVGPTEETVKLLAVRLLPYRHESFDAVVDGAVYGAAAGLGFATIENALYISRGITMSGQVVGQTGLGELIGMGAGITALRALAGPGHVIYSAFAGYYLGLAKFNPDRSGPIVVKGLLIAALIHGLYNSLVQIVPGALNLLFGVPVLVGFFGFVVVFDGVFGCVLYRKLKRYATAYRVSREDEIDESEFSPEVAEFDG
jgi:RsiW-degrading membrane proteinase PrsW (M82 family)